MFVSEMFRVVVVDYIVYHYYFFMDKDYFHVIVPDGGYYRNAPCALN